MRRYFSPEAAKRFYDRVGLLEDSQAFYEDPALDMIVRVGRFRSAGSVFEFGCGTGRFAERLLGEELPADACYTACDISPKMVTLAAERLKQFGQRVELFERKDTLQPLFGGAKYDRIVTTYVLDLLPEDEIAAFLAAARNALSTVGLLCTASIAPGTGLARAAVSNVWSALHRLSPVLTGGCRPIDLPSMFVPESWSVVHSGTVSAWGVTSCVVIASPR